MIKALTMGSLFFVAAGSAFAATPNLEYTYIDVEYHDNTFEEYDGDGYGIEGAYAFGDNYFVFATLTEDVLDASYTTSGLYPLPNETYFYTSHVTLESTARNIALGAGMAWPVGESVDLVGRAFYQDSDIDQATSGTFELADGNGDVQQSGSLCGFSVCYNPSFSESGLGIQAGVRAAIMPRIELYGDVTYVDIDMPDDADGYDLDAGETSLEAGARFTVTDWMRLTLGYYKRGDFESTQLAARFVL